MRKGIVTVIATSVVLGFAVFGILAAGAATTSTFTPVVNPLTGLPATGGLGGMSCTSSTSCVAVGQDGNFQPLVLTGDPSSWGAAQAREIPLGNAFGHGGSTLMAITCTSSTSCVAVGLSGNYQPLVLNGNPATWGASQAHQVTLGSAFGSGGGLMSVACASSTSCVAVGFDNHGQPLVLAGDPATWSATQAKQITLGTALGSAGSLQSVACTSASSCVAAGQDGNNQPLVLTGNPATWGVSQAHQITLGTAFGSGGNLGSITCTSSTSCVTVGGDSKGQPVVLSGNPASWGAAQAHEVTLGSSFASGGSLSSVTCTSGTYCVAVGLDNKSQPLVVHGDPSTWSAAQAQEVTLGDAFGAGGYPSSVVCSSSTSCVVAGQDGNYEPLVLAGDPATWSSAQAAEIALTAPAFGPAESRESLTCTSATSCFKLGWNPAGDPFVLQGHPGTWNQGAAEVMSKGHFDLLADAVCISSTSCVAVGQNGNGPIVLGGNPGNWATATPKQITLGQTFGGWGGLSSVACPASTYCVAVGQDGSDLPLVLAGNPSTWGAGQAKQISLGSAFGRHGVLVSIDCTSSAHCIAVGEDAKSQPLVLIGNPHTWTASQAKQITLGTAFGSSGSLASVTCPSSTYCVTAGQSGGGALYSHTALKPRPLVLKGNPSSWSSSTAFDLRVPSPTASTVGGFSSVAAGGSGYLASISCQSTTFCVVVGGDNRSAPLYMTGSPAKWTSTSTLVRPTQTGAAFKKARITTSYCTPTVCFAGGYSNGGDFVATVK